MATKKSTGSKGGAKKSTAKAAKGKKVAAKAAKPAKGGKKGAAAKKRGYTKRERSADFLNKKGNGLSKDLPAGKVAMPWSPYLRNAKSLLRIARGQDADTVRWLRNKMNDPSFYKKNGTFARMLKSGAIYRNKRGATSFDSSKLDDRMRKEFEKAGLKTGTRIHFGQEGRGR